MGRPRLESPVPQHTRLDSASCLGLAHFVESGLRRPSATPWHFNVPTFLCWQVRAREFHSQESPFLKTVPAASRAREGMQGTGHRTAALVKRRETGRRPHRTWLAGPQAPKGRGSRVPQGRRCPSAQPAFCSRPTRRPGALSRANGLEATGSREILFKRKGRELRLGARLEASKPGDRPGEAPGPSGT